MNETQELFVQELAESISHSVVYLGDSEKTKSSVTFMLAVFDEELEHVGGATVQFKYRGKKLVSLKVLGSAGIFKLDNAAGKALVVLAGKFMKN